MLERNGTILVASVLYAAWIAVSAISAVKAQTDGAGFLPPAEAPTVRTAADSGDDRAAVRGTPAGPVRGLPPFVRRILQHRRAVAVAAILCCLLAVAWAVPARIRRKRDEKRFMTTTRLSLMDGEVQRACLHIEKNYRNQSLSPASVCAGIVTGETFLEAMFERELGMSIAAYIDQVRMHHAKQIVIWNPGADARFVASQVGFSQPDAFEKAFEKAAGIDFESFRREKPGNPP